MAGAILTRSSSRQRCQTTDKARYSEYLNTVKNGKCPYRKSAGMPQAVQRGAPLRRRRKLCFWTACFCNPSVFAVTAPLSKKSLLCKSFSGARNSPLFLISVGFSCGACACLGARERSERVTGRRQPPRQLCRRLVQDKHTSRSHTRIFTAYRPNKHRREIFPKQCVP